MSTQEDLEKRIAFLEKLLQTQGIASCPLCGGVMRESPKFGGNFYCQQEKGHCGEWVLRTVPNRKRGRWPDAYFHRTHVKDGQVVPFGQVSEYRDDAVFRRVIFVAGKEVVEG